MWKNKKGNIELEMNGNLSTLFNSFLELRKSSLASAQSEVEKRFSEKGKYFSEEERKIRHT